MYWRRMNTFEKRDSCSADRSDGVMRSRMKRTWSAIFYLSLHDKGNWR